MDQEQIDLIRRVIASILGSEESGPEKERRLRSYLATQGFSGANPLEDFNVAAMSPEEAPPHTRPIQGGGAGDFVNAITTPVTSRLTRALAGGEDELRPGQQLTAREMSNQLDDLHARNPVLGRIVEYGVPATVGVVGALGNVARRSARKAAISAAERTSARNTAMSQIDDVAANATDEANQALARMTEPIVQSHSKYPTFSEANDIVRSAARATRGGVRSGLEQGNVDIVRANMGIARDARKATVSVLRNDAIRASEAPRAGFDFVDFLKRHKLPVGIGLGGGGGYLMDRMWKMLRGAQDRGTAGLRPD